jgi:TonB family protein
MTLLGSTLLVLAVAGASPAPANTSAAKWRIGPSEDACILTRVPVTKDDPTFTLKQMLGGTGARIALGGRSFATGRPPTSASVIFSPSQQSFKLEPGTGRYAREADGSFSFYAVDPALRDAFAQSNGATFRFGNRVVASVSYEHAAAAEASLSTCYTNLLRSHDLDPATVVEIPRDRGLAAMPSPDSYPRNAQMYGAQGRTIIAVGIDQAGNPSACKVLKRSAYTVFDETTCDNYRRKLRLDPAPNGPETRWGIVAVNWMISR